MNHLVVFDLETTGLSRDKDHIIQFAAIKIDRSTNKIIEEKNLYIQPEGNYTIEIAAYFKHHISAEFLKDKPHFSDVALEIINFINGCDILTYNGNAFDIPFLKTAIIKAGYGSCLDFTAINCYDSFLEEKRRNGNTLEETYYRYKGKTMSESGLTAHDAFSDVKATYSVFYAQNKIKQVEPEDMIGEDNAVKIMEFQGKQVPCMALGKYRGVSLEYISSIDQGYLNWAISDKCGFIQSTKDYISRYIK